MQNHHLWKFPKDLLPDLKKEYLAGNWLWLINMWNYYLAGETLCAVCPASVDKIREYLKPIFLADIEVLHREGKEAGQDELVELFAKYVSPTVDPLTVQKIPPRTLKGTVCAFANADLRARLVSERRRFKLLSTVFKIDRKTFGLRYCDEC